MRDHSYSLEEILSAHYDWFSLLVNLPCNSDDINLEDWRNNIGNNILSESMFVHEYIHFLQNFSTNWGVSIFVDFAKSTIKLNRNIESENEKFSIPLNKSTFNEPQWKDGVEMRKQTLERFHTGDYVVENEKSINGQFVLTFTDTSAILSNAYYDFGLGLKLIREHMANMGQFLFQKKTDEEIWLEIKELSIDNYMYSLLFRYFYLSKKYNQIANGIFYLMQYCLRTLEPNLALKRFLQFQKKNNVKKQINLLRQVLIWQNEPSERDFFLRDEINTKKHCENLIEFTEKHKQSHDLYMFFDTLAKYSINNLNNIKKTGLVFDLNEQLSDLKYWNSIIVKFGTGIISYSNCTKIYGHSGHIDQMNDSFLFLLSVNNILKDLFEGKINPCPFSDGDNGHLHICKSTELVNDKCYKNPFLKSKGFKTEKKCLYGNGTFLLGYTNKIQFESE